MSSCRRKLRHGHDHGVNFTAAAELKSLAQLHYSNNCNHRPDDALKVPKKGDAGHRLPVPGSPVTPVRPRLAVATLLSVCPDALCL